jgi:hypothetical protein
MCNCIEEVNQELKNQNMNTQIEWTFGMKGVINKILVAAIKLDDKVKKKPIKLFATYCPSAAKSTKNKLEKELMERC